MASVVFDISDLLKKTDNMVKNLGDMSSLFRAISELELSQTKLRFRAEKDPSGKLWPDPVTIRRDGGGRREGGFSREQSWNYVLKSNFHATPPGWHFFDRSRGDRALRDTSNLFNSLGSSWGKDYAVVGTNVEYADKLQSGRFPFLGINDRTRKNVNDALGSFMKGLLK